VIRSEPNFLKIGVQLIAYLFSVITKQLVCYCRSFFHNLKTKTINNSRMFYSEKQKSHHLQQQHQQQQQQQHQQQFHPNQFNQAPPPKLSKSNEIERSESKNWNLIINYEIFIRYRQHDRSLSRLRFEN